MCRLTSYIAIWYIPTSNSLCAQHKIICSKTSAVIMTVGYRGVLAPEAEMGIGAPRRVRLASVEGALLRYWGSGAKPQPPTLLGAFRCKWNPFLNSVNTIFNSACHTRKHRRRSPSLLWGLGTRGGAPAANALGALGCKWNPFLKTINTIFNSACQTDEHRWRSPSLLGV